MRQPRAPSLLDSLLPIGVLIGLLALTIALFGVSATDGPLQVALLLSAAFASLIAIFLFFSIASSSFLNYANVTAIFFSTVVIGLLALGLWMLRRRRFPQGAASIVVAALVLLWFALTDTVPGDFTGMTPYVATLLVLALASQRLRPPAADGVVYRKGQGR